MSSDRALSFNFTLSSGVVVQVAEAFKYFVASVDSPCVLLTEADFSESQGLPADRFILFVSAAFSGLLILSARQSEGSDAAIVSLTCEPTAIADFIEALAQSTPVSAQMANALEQAQSLLQPGDSQLQAALAAQLLPLMAQSQASEALPWVPYRDRQQEEQAQILNQVTTQIRQSHELSQILSTTVQQVRQVLQADRVVIYEINQVALSELEKSAALENELSDIEFGRISHEARRDLSLPTVIDFAEGVHCFVEDRNYREKYRKGQVLAIADIEATLSSSPCLMALLRKVKVRAKMVIPITVQEELWGLLIAHQSAPRQWQPSEQTFLQQVAEQLAIAIYQANLYAQLQQQKHLLEKFADQRTQDLYDALEAAQAASLAKSEFLATMSHELRTPLTCIIGMTNTLLRIQSKEGVNPPISPAQISKYLKTIQSSGEHLLQLVNDILEISDVEAGRAILQLQPFSLQQTVQDIIKACQDTATRRKITLEFENRLEPLYSDNLTASTDTFCADPRRVRQILLNLLSNAIKFTPEQGRVTLRLWRESGTAVFQVEDTGIGISEEQRSLLFRKFQQLDMSTQRSYEGLGLGLALTKQLIDLHGGWIEVESAVNAGSTFTVWLPEQVARERDEELPAAPACALDARRGRVALVEDDEAQADLICDLLTTAGYQIVWMVDAIAVVPQLKILQPSLVLLSSQLTRTDSREILHELQTALPNENLRVLMLLHPEEASRPWLAAGADDCIKEAIAQPERLLDKVAALVDPGVMVNVAGS
ncbi:MAG TPA: GAF domain-containing protein [Leptolyngbyaceae cyanobacterium M33_DOE_097]|nr:GAF domain-containing protein [Leptolyngbyaceae cyanobacterium M33_DOE_097]